MYSNNRVFIVEYWITATINIERHWVKWNIELAIILMYAIQILISVNIVNVTPFEQCNEWREQMFNFQENYFASIILVANKCDIFCFDKHSTSI